MRIVYFIIQILLIVTTGWSGDVSTFKNLGFSPNSRYFQFGLYGIDEATKNPYAEVYTVDVNKNDFISNGNSKSLFPIQVTLGDAGLSALLSHLEKLTQQRKALKLDYLRQGRPIYFRVISDDNPQKTNSFKVMDYETQREYLVQLKENVRSSSDGSIQSSFGIDLTVKDKQGKLLGSYQVGHPSFERKGIQKYTVVQMILTPNDKALIFVVEREESDGRGGVSIRSMVETVVF